MCDFGREPSPKGGFVEEDRHIAAEQKSRAKKNESAGSHIPGAIGREKSYFGYVGGGGESSAKMTAVSLESKAVRPPRNERAEWHERWVLTLSFSSNRTHANRSSPWRVLTVSEGSWAKGGLNPSAAWPGR